MTPEAFALKVLDDTRPMRPTDPDTVRYVKASTPGFGTLVVEMTTDATYGSFQGYGLHGSDVASPEAHDFLYDVCSELERGPR